SAGKPWTQPIPISQHFAWITALKSCPTINRVRLKSSFLHWNGPVHVQPANGGRIYRIPGQVDSSNHPDQNSRHKKNNNPKIAGPSGAPFKNTSHNIEKANSHQACHKH